MIQKLWRVWRLAVWQNRFRGAEAALEAFANYQHTTMGQSGQWCSVEQYEEHLGRRVNRCAFEVVRYSLLLGKEAPALRAYDRGSNA